MKVKMRKIEFAIAGMLSASLAGAAIAQDASANIAARQNDMRTIQATNMILNDATGVGDMARAKDAAMKINAAYKDVATRFTPGSDKASGKTTRARADIWADPAAFKAKVDHAIDISNKLVTATSGTDVNAARIASGELNALCDDCHGKYR